MSFFSKIFGDAHQRYLEKSKPIIEKISSLENRFEAFSLAQFREKTEVFKGQAKEGAPLDEILPEAFALVREAGKRIRHKDKNNPKDRLTLEVLVIRFIMTPLSYCRATRTRTSPCPP